MKKLASTALAFALILSVCSCSDKNSLSSLVPNNTDPDPAASAGADPASGDKSDTNSSRDLASMSPEEITASLSLEEKAAQMVLPAVYNVDPDTMAEFDYGSVLSTFGPLEDHEWAELVDDLQKGALDSKTGIPFVYGQDDVHGVNTCLNSVIFPHNIGLGAANDKELMYQVGLITADEAKICHMLWNYAPCVAQSVDPRWGRTYESYGADLNMITELSSAYSKGLIDGGMIVCPKHFFADGNVLYGTGEKDDIEMLIDRGDAQLSDDEINKLLDVYQNLIDRGVQTIMISHSSLNGLKMHENAKYIQYLKNEMGFNGFIVSDWDSVKHTSPSSYKEQVITSVNAGIDMFMEPDTFEEARQIIINGVNDGDITEDRVNDAVNRIIRVKKDAGIFDDPLFENLNTKQSSVGSDEYRAVAEKLVEESLVLLKNSNDTLPIKSGSKVYVTGPAADNAPAQCGGWTLEWNGSSEPDMPGVTTILDGFTNNAEKYGITVTTDKNDADDADVVVLVVGETNYSEWNGDTEDMELCGELGLTGNSKAIKEARELGKPVVACIVAGRQVIIDQQDFDSWDSVVMCYLPGSEGQGVADVLCGDAQFSGKLPSPWYSSVDQIGSDSPWLEIGYGLEY